MTSLRQLSDAIPRRRLAAGALAGLSLTALFLWLALRGLDPAELRRTLAGADPGLVAGTVGAMVVVYALQAERWRRVARHEGEPARRTWREFFRLVIVGVGVNNVVPGRPGELVRTFLLSRAICTPVSRSLATVLVDRSADLVTLVVALLAGIAFFHGDTWLRNLTWSGFLLAALVALGLAGMWWYSHRSPRGRARGGDETVERSRTREQLSGFVRAAALALSGNGLPWIALLSLLAWSTWALGAWLAARAVGVELTPAEVVFVTAVMNLGVAIPSSPGFVGTYQWLAVVSLALFDVGRAQAFAFSIVLQASWLVPSTLGALGIALAHLGGGAPGRRPRLAGGAQRAP